MYLFCCLLQLISTIINKFIYGYEQLLDTIICSESINVFSQKKASNKLQTNLHVT